MLNMVFDRTQFDVDSLASLKKKILVYGLNSLTEAEMAEYLQSKGAWNVSDLNRIADAIIFIRDEFIRYGHIVPVSFQQNWVKEDIFYKEDMTRMLSMVDVLVGMITMPTYTPLIPDSVYTFGKANDLERILHDLYDSIKRMEQSTWRSGEILSGGFNA